MLDNLRQSVGLLYARWHFRTERDPEQPLTDFLRRSQSILVLLPDGYNEAVIAGNSLKNLKDLLQNVHLTIVTTGIHPTPLSSSRRVEVIRIDDGDVNKFSLPRRPALQRILARSYDVAVDLNLDFVLHAAYICKASRA